MDYEKKYKEALERAKEWFKPEEPDSYTCIVESIFPELKESEDEKIRKELIQFFSDKDEEDYEGLHPRAQIVAWLEKQGEHARFIEAIQVGDQVTKNEDGVLVNLSQLKRVAKKDEKQGEQRLAEWTAEDEEELKIALNTLEEAGQYSSAKWLKNVCLVPQTMQKPAWSEEDKCMLNNVIDTLKPLSQTTHSGYSINSMIDWLKDLKDRVQPSQEWSDEEIENCAREAEDNNCIILAKHIRQLKSLRTKNHWKPSEEQIVALECAANDVQRFSNRSLTLQVENESYWRNLVSLLKQLKKLREE